MVAVARNDFDVIQHLGTAFSVTLVHHNVNTEAAVDPMFFAVHPDQGFIVVQHQHLQQPFDGGAFPLGQTVIHMLDPLQQSGFGNLTPADLLEQLFGAF